MSSTRAPYIGRGRHLAGSSSPASETPIALARTQEPTLAPAALYRPVVDVSQDPGVIAAQAAKDAAWAALDEATATTLCRRGCHDIELGRTAIAASGALALARDAARARIRGGL